MNSIKLQNRMDSIFMNSEYSKASDPHRLLLNLSDKINLNRNNKYVVLSNHSIYPASKYWSPGRPKDVPLQRPQYVS